MNDPRKLFVDERMRGLCAFCGRKPNTRDHCPSKVLLDEPYPPNLAIVDSCAKCNSSFSLDEEYVATLVECVLRGSTDPDAVQRSGIKKTLLHAPRLAAQIQSRMTSDLKGNQIWQADMDRVRRVVLKLARGHLDYELSVQEIGEPTEFFACPLMSMTDREKANFENPNPHSSSLYPELGSRAFMRLFASNGDGYGDGWITVQDGRYRYLVGQTQGNFVHIALSEYLACRAAWH